MTTLRRGRAVLTIDEMLEAADQCLEWRDDFDRSNEEWALAQHLLEEKDVVRLMVIGGGSDEEIGRLAAAYASGEVPAQDTERLTALLVAGLLEYRARSRA